MQSFRLPAIQRFHLLAQICLIFRDNDEIFPQTSNVITWYFERNLNISFDTVALYNMNYLHQQEQEEYSEGKDSYYSPYSQTWW